MTYNATYLKSKVLRSEVKIEIKRINSSGVYESSWVNIEDLTATEVKAHNSIPGISYSLPNETYSYGVLKVPDCTLKLASINGEFDSETNTNSIFNGYVRHKTLVKISHGYLNNETGNYEYIEVYRGFINEISNNTKVSNDNTYQDLFIEDLLTFLLKEYTFSDFTLTSTTLEAFLYELFNRSEFTDFLTVSTGNIEAGYDIQNIDDTALEGQTQWLKILQDLSIGHSFLYQREGVLYYKPIEASTQDIFTFDRDSIIKVSNFSSGIDEVFEILYWKDTALKFESPTNLYHRSKTFDVETITNSTDRINILSTVGTRTSEVRKKLKLKVVLFVNLFIFDRVIANAGDYETTDGLIWDQGEWDEESSTSNLGASFSDAGAIWMIKEIKHNFQAGTTELMLEAI